MSDDEDIPYLTQDADRDNWYFDMRGSVLGFDPSKSLEQLQEDLSHLREYLEQLKHEWVRETVFNRGPLGAALFNDLKLVRAQLETCKSSIIAHRGKPVPSEFDIEKPRQAIGRIKPGILFEKAQAEEIARLKNISWTTRTSTVNSNKVLILENENDEAVTFFLRCIRKDGSCTDKTLSIDGKKTKEIGFMEGWKGNWAPRERFEVWTVDHPVLAWHAEIS
jgi:hypothetical protein